MSAWHERGFPSPFASRPRLPEHLRRPDGSLTAADEVAHGRRVAAETWLARHGLTADVDDVLARAEAAGEHVAAAEALHGAPTPAAERDVGGVEVP